MYYKNTTNKHLSLSDREIIETGINNGSSKSSIAETLGKHKSTISKEIKLHRTLTSKCPLPLECSNYKKCKYGRNCIKTCLDYRPFKCTYRDRSPGACNGCSLYSSCRFNKYRYRAKEADNEYRETLVLSRSGINATFNEIKELGELIKPYIDNGLSPYAILKAHPEIKQSEMTLYTYIENGIFQAVGISIKDIDLRRKSSRKITKRLSNTYKKREDKSYLKGRLYKDYLDYLKENPNARICQMDSVYNDGTNGPFMQTFKFISYSFVIILFHKTKTAESMLQGINLLEELLGKELFEKEVEVLLADRGTEFIKAKEIEYRNDKTQRTRIFYCDPMASGQKGSLEVSHQDIRCICPKNIDLYTLGLKKQKQANLISSHINSYPKEKILNGKTPFQYLKFMNPQMVDKLLDFGISEIPINDVVMKPYLLKR